MKNTSAVRKTSDDLPDEDLGKTQEEVTKLLDANILKAIERGYMAKEVAAIMAEGNVVIPVSVIRVKVFPAKVTPRKHKLKPRPEATKPAAAPSVTSHTQEKIPDFYALDKPDSEFRS